MKISVKKAVETAEEVEVELPAYGMQHLDDSVSYWMVDVDLKRYSVDLTRWAAVNVEIEGVRADDARNAAYHFGLGQFASSREEYLEALADARMILARFPGWNGDPP